MSKSSASALAQGVEQYVTIGDGDELTEQQLKDKKLAHGLNTGDTGDHRKGAGGEDFGSDISDQHGSPTSTNSSQDAGRAGHLGSTTKRNGVDQNMSMDMTEERTVEMALLEENSILKRELMKVQQKMKDQSRGESKIDEEPTWIFIPKSDVKGYINPITVETVSSKLGTPISSLEPYVDVASLSIRISRPVPNVHTLLFLPVISPALSADELKEIAQLATMRDRKLTLLLLPPSSTPCDWLTYITRIKDYATIINGWPTEITSRVQCLGFQYFLQENVIFPTELAPGGVPTDLEEGTFHLRKLMDWISGHLTTLSLTAELPKLTIEKITEVIKSYASYSTPRPFKKDTSGQHHHHQESSSYRSYPRDNSRSHRGNRFRPYPK